MQKSGDISICVDMHRVNEVVVRELHPFPTISEILEHMSGAAVLSKLVIMKLLRFHAISHLHVQALTISRFLPCFFSTKSLKLSSLMQTSFYGLDDAPHHVLSPLQMNWHSHMLQTRNAPKAIL